MLDTMSDRKHNIQQEMLVKHNLTWGAKCCNIAEPTYVEPTMLEHLTGL